MITLRLVPMTDEFVDFVRLVTDGDIAEISRCLSVNPTLATRSADTGATRRVSVPFFFKNIKHYFYEGDTALHLAAAAFRRDVAKLLITHGANCRARNRRGAQPLHYAADANHVDPIAQADTIEYLIAVGADPNALDKSGVSPLHRAVRTRSLAAVRALIDGGANIALLNKSGSTPLYLANHTTGRSGSGSKHARAQAAGIIRLLRELGAVTMLLLMFAATSAVLAAQERYVRAEENANHELVITTASGQRVVLKKGRDEEQKEDQVGFSHIAISSDATAVGWLAEYPNCCTSYPIPTRVEVYSNGQRRTFNPSIVSWHWCFVDGPARIAAISSTVHGPQHEVLELWDVNSGKKLEEFFWLVDEKHPDAPKWVNAIRADYAKAAGRTHRCSTHEP